MIAGMLFLAFAFGAHLLFGATATAAAKYWLNTLEQTQQQLTGLFLFNNARRLSMAYLMFLVLVPVSLFFMGVSTVLVVMMLVVLLCLPRLLFAILRKRRAVAINNALPDALSQLASAMRAGATFTVALQGLTEEDAGPLGEELSLMLREHRIGARMDDALDNLAERVQSEEMDLVVSAVLIAQDVGGNLAEILQGLATSIRRKLEMEGKIAALTSQGMLQGYVVSALPFGLLGVMCLVEPDATLPIFNSVLGWLTLSVMAVMQCCGALMIKKIVTIEV